MTVSASTVDADGVVLVQVEFEAAPIFSYTTRVVNGDDGLPHGTIEVLIDPNDPNPLPVGSAYASSVIDLVATPEAGFELLRWTNTDNDASTAISARRKSFIRRIRRRCGGKSAMRALSSMTGTKTGTI